jgi:hypothetical protein
MKKNEKIKKVRRLPRGKASLQRGLSFFCNAAICCFERGVNTGNSFAIDELLRWLNFPPIFENILKAMEDELIKNSTQIWKKLRSDGGIFDKLKSITGEIFVIVFAVSFSIWINNRTENRKEQEEVLEFLRICREEMKADSVDLIRCKNELASAIQTNSVLLQLTESSLDSIKKNNLPIGFNGKPIIRRTHLAGYEGFKTSGRLGNIDNKQLMKNIMEYYEVIMPSLLQADEAYNGSCSKTVDRIMDRVSEKGKDAFLEKRIRMELNLNVNIASRLVPGYEDVLHWSMDLKKDIQNEISLKEEAFWF